MLTVVPEPAGDDVRTGGVQLSESSSVIDDIVREGARRMLAEAVLAEVEVYTAAFARERDEAGHRLVVRNGCHEPREVLTSAGAVEVQAPRVNDKRIDPDTGERQRFRSVILPPWCRKTPKITEVLPLLYLPWAVLWGLRACTGPVPRHEQRPVQLGDHQAHRDLAGRATGFRCPRSVWCGLRVSVG